MATTTQCFSSTQSKSPSRSFLKYESEDLNKFGLNIPGQQLTFALGSILGHKGPITDAKSIQRGILLFGAPDCGDEELLRCVLHNIPETRIFKLDLSETESDDSESYVADLFDKAKSWNNGKGLIYINGFNILFTQPGHKHVIKQMDNLNSSNSNCFVVAHATEPWKLSKECFSQFQKKIYIPMPKALEKVSLLQFYLSQLKLNRELEKPQTIAFSDLQQVASLPQLQRATWLDLERFIEESFLTALHKDFGIRNYPDMKEVKLSLEEEEDIKKNLQIKVDHMRSVAISWGTFHGYGSCMDGELEKFKAEWKVVDLGQLMMEKEEDYRDSEKEEDEGFSDLFLNLIVECCYWL